MEFKIVLSHGPVVWAVELVAISLDTGKEIGRFMLNSTMNFMAANDYMDRLGKFTGFDCVESMTGDLTQLS